MKIVRKIALIFILAFLCVAVALPSATALAVPVANPNQAPRMVTVCLYGDTTTQMAFNWVTTDFTDSDVQVWEQSSASNVKEIVGTVSKSLVDGENAYVHRAVATNLNAGTTYNFRVGDKELDVWSEIGSFSTSKSSAFTFLHVSDPQASDKSFYEDYAKLLSKATQHDDIAFIALTGDIVNNSWAGHTPVLQQWEWALTDAFDTYGNLPVAAVAGNHDAADNDFASRFNFNVPQDADTTTGCYYSFNWGSAHFVCINTNDTQNADNADATGLSETQYNWIKSDLAANKNAEWLIVLMHKGIYDSGDHCLNADTDDGKKDYDIDKIRMQLAPLFSQYGVDLVLQGHDHLFSKSAPIYATIQDGVLTETPDDAETVLRTIGGVETNCHLSPKGTIYVNSGSCSGSKYYNPNLNYNTNLIDRTKNTGTLTYSTVTIDGESLVVNTYILGEDNNVQLFYSFAIVKDSGVSGVFPSWKIAVIAISGVVAVGAAVAVTVVVLKRKKSSI